MIIIGIDPGLDGSLARLSGTNYETWDTPTAKDGTHRVLLPVEMLGILNVAAGISPPDQVIVFIEKVKSFPKQGSTSAFNFGEGYGLWKGLVVALGFRIEQVLPQTWQKVMYAGMQGGKESSIIRCQELFPKADLTKGPRTRKLHDGRSDALLIAEYGRRALGLAE